MTVVYVPAEKTLAIITQLMTYGAVVRYYSGGIEFNEMLDEEDYVVVYDRVREELNE